MQDAAEKRDPESEKQELRRLIHELEESERRARETLGMIDAALQRTRDRIDAERAEAEKRRKFKG